MHGVRQWGLGARMAMVVVLAVVGTAVLGAANVLREDSASVPAAAPSVAPSASRSPVPSADPFGPRFPIVTQAGAVIRGVTVEVHVPMAESAGRARTPAPLVVLLPARGISPSQYAQLAHDLASYGLAVVVADEAIPDAVQSVRAWARTVDRDPSAYLAGAIDPRTELVLAVGDGAIAFDLRPTLTLPHALALTDEGRRGTRTNDPIDARREDAIASVARHAAWTLLAATGDPTARSFVDGATTSTMQSTQPTAHN